MKVNIDFERCLDIDVSIDEAEIRAYTDSDGDICTSIVFEFPVMSNLSYILRTLRIKELAGYVYFTDDGCWLRVEGDNLITLSEQEDCICEDILSLVEAD